MTRTLPFIAVPLLALAACGSEPEATPASEEPAVEAPSETQVEEAVEVAQESEAAPSTPDGWREVRCVIDTPGEDYTGPCEFHSEQGGTFTVQRSGNVPVNGATSITVAVIAPGEGDVRGLTQDGINSRWGSATRSDEDAACWEGADFSVCAY